MKKPINNRVQIAILFLFSMSSFAEDLYMREAASGSGNGSDWNNAWKTPAAVVWGSGAGKLSAGDTLWIAGGSYTNLILDGSGTLGNNIYIKRVRTTNSVPAAAAGWSDAFDATPKIVQLYCNTPGNGHFITIDGQVPYTGIMFTNNSAGFTNVAETLGAQDTYTIDLSASGASSLDFINVEMCGRGSDTQNFGEGINSGDPTAEGRCFSANNNTGIQATNLNIMYSWLHNMSTLGLVYQYSESVVYHCVLGNNLVGNTAVNHPNTWVSVGCTNFIFGLNIVSNCQAEGIMFTPDSSSNPPNVNWIIWGNLWIKPKGTVYRILETQSGVQNGPIYFFNNTVDTNGFGIRTDAGGGGTWHASCASSNNISCGGQSIDFGNTNSDYNLAGYAATGTHSMLLTNPAAIFVNFAGGNYHIVTNIVVNFPCNKGITEDPVFAIDIDGVTRGADGVWDLGAYEAVGGAVIPPVITSRARVHR